ncbi:hypothetical protein ACHAQA_004105 [Verticillium albo-atrum]
MDLPSSDVISNQFPSEILTSLPDPQATFWHQPGQASCGPASNGYGGHTNGGGVYAPLKFTYDPNALSEWPASTHSGHGPSYDDFSDRTKEPQAAQPLNDHCQPQNVNLSVGNNSTFCAPSPMSTSSDTATIVPSKDDRGMLPDNGRLSICSSAFSVDNARPGPAASEVHDICLLATQAYLQERRVNRRLRGGRPRRKTQHRSRDRPQAPVDVSPRDTRWAPYVKGEPPGPGIRHRRRSSASTASVAPTRSLLANVSKISTALWKQAQRDRLHVPNSERMALDNMGQLLEWAETVMRGEGEDGQDEVERNLLKVLTAGRNLCAWLGDEVGMEMIEALG